jgi:hypothetical protein
MRTPHLLRSRLAGSLQILNGVFLHLDKSEDALPYIKALTLRRGICIPLDTHWNLHCRWCSLLN